MFFVVAVVVLFYDKGLSKKGLFTISGKNNEIIVTCRE